MLEVTLNLGDTPANGTFVHGTKPVLNIKVDMLDIDQFEVPRNIVDPFKGFEECKGHRCKLSDWIDPDFEFDDP